MTTRFTTLAAGFCLTFVSLHAQDWPKAGNDIYGDAAGDMAGRSVCLSSDGRILAIGEPGHDENGENSGLVRIYNIQGGVWVQVGGDIYGEAGGDNFGSAICLNSDGTIVAAGGHLNSGSKPNAGHVRVFHLTEGDWVQMGSDIDGEDEADFFGTSVSLNGIGSIVAVGAPSNDGNGNLSGHVRIYEYQNENWEQIGDDIDGVSEWDFAGTSVSLNESGTIIAIGIGMFSGSRDVRIFENHSGNWEQVANAIHGELNTEFGVSVDLNSSGSIIAIGSTKGSEIHAGIVQVFENQSGSWVQIGGDICGVAADDQFGNSVSLNSDGTVLAAGAFTNDGNGVDAGQVTVYRFTEGEWTQTGNVMTGIRTQSFFGHSVSLSSNGALMAAGAAGMEPDSGYVQVYGNLNLPEIIAEPEDCIGICPGTDASFSVSVNDAIFYHWQVSKDGGSSWLALTDGDIYHNTTSDTLIISEVIPGMNDYLYRCIITNLAGDVSSSSGAVVLEVIPPTISCPDNVVVNTGDENTYTVSGNEFDAVAGDNCSISSVVNNYNLTSTLAGEVLPAGTHNITWIAGDLAGNMDVCTSNIEVNAGTDVTSRKELNIEVFPNPTSGIVYIQYAVGCRMVISDIYGQTIKSVIIQSDNAFTDLENAPAGVYFIRLTYNELVRTCKVVKK